MPTDEVYSFPTTIYHRILELCVSDARGRYTTDHQLKLTEKAPDPIDIRMWVQKWPTNTCGFKEPWEKPQVTLAPTVLVKFNRSLRYVYHNNRFAYAIRGRVSIRYYDCVNSRKLPGAADPEQGYLRGV